MEICNFVGQRGYLLRRWANGKQNTANWAFRGGILHNYQKSIKSGMTRIKVTAYLARQTEKHKTHRTKVQLVEIIIIFVLTKVYKSIFDHACKLTKIPRLQSYGIFNFCHIWSESVKYLQNFDNSEFSSNILSFHSYSRLNLDRQRQMGTLIVA